MCILCKTFDAKASFFVHEAQYWIKQKRNMPMERPLNRSPPSRLSATNPVSRDVEHFQAQAMVSKWPPGAWLSASDLCLMPRLSLDLCCCCFMAVKLCLLNDARKAAGRYRQRALCLLYYALWWLRLVEFIWCEREPWSRHSSILIYDISGAMRFYKLVSCCCRCGRGGARQ